MYDREHCVGKGRLAVEVTGKGTVSDFVSVHPDARSSLSAWLAETERAAWLNPNQLKKSFGSATIIDGKVVIFNVSGNKYRMETWVNYRTQSVYIRRIGTHQEYDEWEY